MEHACEMRTAHKLVATTIAVDGVGWRDGSKLGTRFLQLNFWETRKYTKY